MFYPSEYQMDAAVKQQFWPLEYNNVSSIAQQQHQIMKMQSNMNIYNNNNTINDEHASMYVFELNKNAQVRTPDNSPSTLQFN